MLAFTSSKRPTAFNILQKLINYNLLSVNKEDIE